MIVQYDEFLHANGSSSDWEERFRLTFADKKSKVYGVADITILAHAGEYRCEWNLIIDGQSYHSIDNHPYESKEGAKSVGGKILKYKVAGKEDFEIQLKSSQLEGVIAVHAYNSTYDFPCAPGRPTDSKREEFESQLWKRYEQRCRFSGEVSIRDGKTKKIEAYGEREHMWGSMLWKNLHVSSRCYIQFKDMSISLSYLDLEGSVVSNGFISRKSGNIPVIGIEFEHIELDRSGKLRSSETSYLDSQDDRDLIVTNALHMCDVVDIRAGKKKFIRFRSFSEFTIIGANKKGVGFEEHLILPDLVKSYISEK
jgi:hypothetical protein